MRGLLDSHCHLDDPRYVDREGVERRRLEAGVRVLVPGVRPWEFDRLRHDGGARGWLIGLGFHPQFIPSGLMEFPFQLLGKILRHESAGAQAIGECGLHRPNPTPMPDQLALLRLHAEAARKHDLPIVLHCVRCHHILPGFLAEFIARNGPIRGVIHSYSGGAGLVPVYEKLGLHLSFGGLITWPTATRPIAALRAVRPDRLLLETDGPDQPPYLPPPPDLPQLQRADLVDRRADRSRVAQSEPSMLPMIAAKAAELRSVALPEFLEQLDANAAALGW